MADSYLLSVPPHLVRYYSVFAITHGLVAVDRDLPCDRLDDAQQRFTNVGVAVRFYGRRVHLIEEAVVHLFDHDLSLTRRTLLRFVTKVDPQRRQKNEGEDDRDHHVVVDAAARIRPPDVAFDGLGDLAHRWVQCTLFAVRYSHLTLSSRARTLVRVEGSAVAFPLRTAYP